MVAGVWRRSGALWTRRSNFVVCGRPLKPMAAPRRQALTCLLGRHFQVETVPKSSHASDKRWAALGLDLLPQAQDVDVYRAVRDRPVMPPYRIEQLFAAEYDSRDGSSGIPAAGTRWP